MEIHYSIGARANDVKVIDLDARTLLRREARSLGDRPVKAAERIALQEAICLIRLGMADLLRIKDKTHLENAVTRAAACAEVMATGASVVIGQEQIADARGSESLQDLAIELARERHGLLPPTSSNGTSPAYISRGWPTHEECARLAHKLVHEMSYTYADAARILEMSDWYERPTLWTRQGISRLLWEECDGEKYPKYDHREVIGAQSRQPGRLHLPCSEIHFMAALGSKDAEAGARKFDAALSEPHLAVIPTDPQHINDGLAQLLSQIMDNGHYRTLYVANPDTIFSTPAQRNVVYDMALFRGIQVMENGVPIQAVNENPNYNRLLREGTELFAALRIRDQATVLEETRSIDYAQRKAVELDRKGLPLREIAATLEAEAIPTRSHTGSWSPSAVKELLNFDQQAGR
ncbi:hypothetical protein [Streptomyces sp. NPDC001781]